MDTANNKLEYSTNAGGDDSSSGSITSRTSKEERTKRFLGLVLEH